MRALFVLFVFCAACASDDTAGDDGTGGGGGGGGGGSMCSSSPGGADTCTGDTICVAGACVAAYPRVYRITSLRHMVPTTGPNGSWDAGAGAPDLFVKIAVNGTVTATTPVVSDTFDASWPGPYSITLNAAGSSLVLTSFDEDISANDPGYECSASPITTAQLRQRVVGCMPATWLMAWQINPM